MATETNVTQVYTKTQNLSVTVRDGRIDRVTTWTTGVPLSTKVIAEVPASFRR